MNVPAVPTWLYRGYTGHEHLPLFNLINMNGRLYDPLVGRMLSTDNNVQEPGNTQNYNRYSYAFNNPLRYTDPDGEFVFIPILIGAAIGATLHLLNHLDKNEMSFRNWNWGNFIGATLGGAAAGWASAAIGAGLAAAHIGGIYGGAVLGGSAAFTGSFTSNLVSNTINNKEFTFKENLLNPLLAGVAGAITGGILGGLDAYSDGMKLWDGRGKQVDNVFVNNSGGVSTNTVNDKPQSIAGTPYEAAQRQNNIATNVRGVPTNGTVNASNPGFEGGYNIRVQAQLSGTEVYNLNMDGTNILTINTTRTVTVRVPSGNHVFTFGITGRGNLPMGQAVAGVSTRISTNYRSWSGLFWFK